MLLPDFIARGRFHSHSIKEPVEQELKHLETAGILKRVTHSEWAAPIVSVPKKDGRVRVCGDYKVTVNPSLDIGLAERSGATRSPVGLRIAQITYNHTGRGGTSSLSKVIAFCGESEQLYHCHYRREYSKNCIRSIKELLR